MTARAALRAALADGYRHSWRLVPVNAALGIGLVATLYAALYLPAAGAIAFVLLGPVTAALMHCAVTVVETEELRLADAATGLRLHWRRGLLLAALGLATLVLAVVAVAFYARTSVWPLAVVVVYLAAAGAAFQLVVWALAIFHLDAPLAVAFREAALQLFRRPGGTLGLAAALLLVNAAGIAAAVMPFLTITIAYSFLAVAHFANPSRVADELRRA